MKQLTITCPASYGNDATHGKVPTIKAIRELTGAGLKEAKDMSENSQPQVITINEPYFVNNYANPELEIEKIIKILRGCNVHVGGTVRKLLEELRKLAVEALQGGEDELANEILQLALAEKLRRKDDML